ncbi:hypothetical protein ACFRQM_33415 [Streptomyces sp. NPDC056831]|uniref:hypothetical protein n=1 Tax=Streptomyces sp. NPDC056831 TaxID=3345954 RepID=UPI003690E31F
MRPTPDAARPSACAIDVPATSRNIDVREEIIGSRRRVIADTVGLLPAMVVTAAGAQESAVGTRLPEQATATSLAHDVHAAQVQGVQGSILGKLP